MATTARALTASLRRTVPTSRQVMAVRFLQAGRDVGVPGNPDKTITTVEPGELKVTQADAVSGAPGKCHRIICFLHASLSLHG